MRMLSACWRRITTRWPAPSRLVSGRATHAELAAVGADAVLADLAGTEAVVRTIDELTLPAVRSDMEG